MNGSDDEPAITIRIGRDGSVRAETHGLKGPACLPFIPALEQLLQAEVVDSHFTDDYYAVAGQGAGEAQREWQGESE